MRSTGRERQRERALGRADVQGVNTNTHETSVIFTQRSHKHLHAKTEAHIETDSLRDIHIHRHIHTATCDDKMDTYKNQQDQAAGTVTDMETSMYQSTTVAHLRCQPSPFKKIA